VIEAESHAVMNTHKEQDFQDAFKNGRRAEEQKGTASGVMVSSRPKVIF
jgi:hypothetical protein